MARSDHTNSLMESPVTAEETSMMDADREAESSRPEPEAEPEPAPEPEAPAPEAAAAPEPAEQPEIDPDTGKQRKVDYGALHAEREKRRAAEARERAKDQENATLKGRFEVLSELARKSQAPAQHQEVPIEVPDINLDPVGHFQAKDAIRERELTELRNWKKAQDQQSEVRTNVQRIQELAQGHEAEFSKTTTDYQEAFQYLRQNRDNELEAMGYMDPGVRTQIINNDALQIAAQALQTNRNAAEAVYKIAKARGWAGKVPTSQPIPAPSPAPAPHPDAAKLAKVAEGQKTSLSLSQGNGAAPPISTPEMIAKMTDGEFEKWATEDNWKKLMGG